MGAFTVELLLPDVHITTQAADVAFHRQLDRVSPTGARQIADSDVTGDTRR